jgi:GNAT superfamily N-acetyltransferase
VGRRLLECIEAHVREKGKQSIELHACVPLGTPEFEFFVKNGYAPRGDSELVLRLRFDGFSLRPEITARRVELEQEGIEVRYYGGGDWESLSKLLQTHFPRWMRREDTTKHPLLVAVHRDRVIGFAAFVVVDRDGRSAFSPGVDPEYRGRGIGKVMVNVWGAEVKKLGAEESILSTGERNYPAQRIYFEMGYQKLGALCCGMTKELAGG